MGLFWAVSLVRALFMLVFFWWFWGFLNFEFFFIFLLKGWVGLVWGDVHITKKPPRMFFFGVGGPLGGLFCYEMFCFLGRIGMIWLRIWGLGAGGDVEYPSNPCLPKRPRADPYGG